MQLLVSTNIVLLLTILSGCVNKNPPPNWWNGVYETRDLGNVYHWRNGGNATVTCIRDGLITMTAVDNLGRRLWYQTKKNASNYWIDQELADRVILIFSNGREIDVTPYLTKLPDQSFAVWEDYTRKLESEKERFLKAIEGHSLAGLFQRSGAAELPTADSDYRNFLYLDLSDLLGELSGKGSLKIQARFASFPARETHIDLITFHRELSKACRWHKVYKDKFDPKWMLQNPVRGY